MAISFDNLCKSDSDKKIAGICAGFGKNSDIPTWLWRVIFISLIFMHGAGLAAYAALWFFMPNEKTEDTDNKPKKKIKKNKT